MRTSRDEDPSALPSWRGLLLGAIALLAACLVAAWILSLRIEPAKPPPIPTIALPPPALLEPRAEWQPAARVVNDARAISALMLALDGRWPEADRHVHAMAESPAHGDVTAARASNETGLKHFRAGDFAGAVKAFDAASRADPGDAEVANNLAYASMKAGRVRDAVPHLIRSLHLSPSRSSAWINLAEALAALGYDDASFAALLIALRHGTPRGEIRDFLIEAARNHASEAFRKQANRVLERFDSVPAAR